MRRRHTPAYLTVDDALSFDIKTLKRLGFLPPQGQWGSMTWRRQSDDESIASITVCSTQMVDSSATLRLQYETTDSKTGEEQQLDYPVTLETTTPHFGGLRYWMACPKCYRLVAALYLPRNESRFACRVCYHLVYESQRQTPIGRLELKANAIHQRLGGCPGILNDFPLKPKYMHWKTYQRLNDEAERSSRIVLEDAVRRFSPDHQ